MEASPAPKKELTEKQKAKLVRYNAIKDRLKSMGSTLSPQQRFLAQLDSVLLEKGEDAFKAKVRELEGVWAAEQAESVSKKAATKTQKKASKNASAAAAAAAANVPVPVKQVTKTAKKINVPALSNEEQLALLQKRIALKKNASNIFKNMFKRNANHSVTRNKTRYNAILNALAKGEKANNIKAAKTAKNKAASKKRLATIAETKAAENAAKEAAEKEAAEKEAAAPKSYNPFNDGKVTAVPAAMTKSNNPFNLF